MPTQPNIILIMTDDQGWGDTGYNGHPVLRTPHLDLRAKGSASTASTPPPPSARRPAAVASPGAIRIATASSSPTSDTFPRRRSPSPKPSKRRDTPPVTSASGTSERSPPKSRTGGAADAKTSASTTPRRGKTVSTSASPPKWPSQPGTPCASRPDPASTGPDPANGPRTTWRATTPCSGSAPTTGRPVRAAGARSTPADGNRAPLPLKYMARPPRHVRRRRGAASYCRKGDACARPPTRNRSSGAIPSVG